MKKNKQDERKNLDIEENEEQEEEHEEEILAREPGSGEPVEAEDTPVAHVQGNWENNEDFPLSDEVVSDFIVVGTDPEAVMEEMQQHTLDLDVQDDFEERQKLATDKDALNEDLEEHTHQAPKLSGGDVDAAWDYSDQSGEESVGGSVPTPDQDVVDELGEALGIEYADDEELGTAEKLGERDLNRWELNPASAQDIELEDVSPREADPLRLVDEYDEDDDEIEPLEEELAELLDEDLDDLEDELQNEDLDPLDALDGEELDDFDEEDLALLDAEFDDLDEDEDL
jgi:hypothetical protein